MAYAARRAYVEQQPESRPARSFRVVEGSGRAPRSRAGVAPEVIGLIKIAAVALTLIFIIGAIRIAFSAQTVAVMMDNNKLNREIAQVQSLGDDLQVQQSIFGNPTRIERIAIDTLKMVPATSVAELDVSKGSVAPAAPAKGAGMMVAENDGAAAKAGAKASTR